MALPQVQAKSGKMYDVDSPQGKMIVNAPKQPFNKESSALGGGSPILESILAVVTESAGYLKAMAPSQADIRGESIEDANVAPDPNEGRDDAPATKGPGVLSRIKNKFSLGMLLKGGLILALTGIMAFADEFAKLLEPILKFIKEKVWPNAVDVFTDIMEKGSALFRSIGDKLGTIFGDSGGPHGVTLWDRVKAFAGIFADIGGFILGIGNSLITNVLEMFGVNFHPYDSAGAWVLGKLNEVWDGLKTWFTGLGEKWPLLGNIGSWVLEKVTGAFQIFSDWFGEAKEAWAEDGMAGVWSWLKKKVSDAFKPITDFFGSAIGSYKEGGFSGLWDWAKDKLAAVWTKLTSFFTLGSDDSITLDEETGILAWIKSKLLLPFKFLKDLFSWPEKPEEGYFSFEFGGKIMSKFIDLVFLPWNLAINFLKGIFGFSKEDAEKDENYEPFKMSTFMVGLVKSAWDWFKSKFSIDFSEITTGVMDFGSFMKAISFASTNYLKTLLNPFTKGSNVEAAKKSYQDTMSEYGFGDTAGAATVIGAVLNGGAEALASQTAMFEAAGVGTMSFVDNSYTADNSSKSGDTLVADLGTDHAEVTAGAAGSKEHLRNK